MCFGYFTELLVLPVPCDFTETEVGLYQLSFLEFQAMTVSIVPVIDHCLCRSEPFASRLEGDSRTARPDSTVFRRGYRFPPPINYRALPDSTDPDRPCVGSV